VVFSQAADMIAYELLAGSFKSSEFILELLCCRFTMPLGIEVWGFVKVVFK
jgi:hypothetical protein